jgi:hypothetical protein
VPHPRAIAVHPILGGWADVQPDGQHVLRWDASAKRAGAVWVRAAARGPAPPFPTTPFDLHIRGLLPTLRPYSLIALQVRGPGRGGAAGLGWARAPGAQS